MDNAPRGLHEYTTQRGNQDEWYSTGEPESMPDFQSLHEPGMRQFPLKLREVIRANPGYRAFNHWLPDYRNTPFGDAVEEFLILLGIMRVPEGQGAVTISQFEDTAPYRHVSVQRHIE
jgi:hypothetical protein